MRAEALFQVDPQEPLAFETFRASDKGPRTGLREIRFEFSSRGDRVPGRLLLPEDSAVPPPLVLVTHGAGTSKLGEEVEDCLDWSRWGAALAAIDLPLHGERASAKLSERLLALREPAHHTARDAELWIGFVCQAVVDLRRALAALSSRVDPERIALAGFGLGASLGAVLFAEEPRLRAAALAGAVGGFGPVGVDPVGHLARVAPRPLYLVNAAEGARQGGEALHAAAPVASRRCWLDCPESQLARMATAEMGRFLAEALDPA